MKDIKIGDEYWTWITSANDSNTPLVKKIIIKDIFTVMVVVDVQGNNWSLDVPRDKLYESSEEAVKALQEALELNNK